MKEILRRMAARPFVTCELLIASLFVTLLNLASPVFVIQVLNRYVTFGFDGTLLTLTSGMLVAIVLLYGFGAVRARLAVAVSGDDDEHLAQAVHDVITRVKAQHMGADVTRAAQEIPSRLAAVRAAYEGANITQVLDAPFAILYLLVAGLLSPVLALVGFAGMISVALVSLFAVSSQQKTGLAVEAEESSRRRMTGVALGDPDTVRVFRAANFVRRAWRESLENLSGLRARMGIQRNRTRYTSSSIVLLQSVGIYAIGAMQVVEGDLTVGGLIGINILTSRAVAAGSGLATAIVLFSKAKKARADLDRFMALPREAESGTAKGSFSGKVELQDVTFGWPGQHSPLFESFSLELLPGTLTVVQGPNGCGKTTFARMLAGLVDPLRGDVQADGITLRQIAPDWWRQQVSYLPQETAFVPASIRENITMPVPDADEGVVNAVVNAADLAQSVFSMPDGLETVLHDGGRSLSMGIRKRIAFARALAVRGSLVVLDEPTESLDMQGRKALIKAVVMLLKEGKTVVAVSHDPELVRLAWQRVDLGSKPKPNVARRSKQQVADVEVSGVESVTEQVGGESHE